MLPNRPNSSFVAIRLCLLSSLLSLFLLNGCVANIESSIVAPEVQLSDTKEYFSASGSAINIGRFTDKRIVDEVASPQFVSPEGHVSDRISDAFARALKARGVIVVANSPKTIQGTVTSWESHYEGSANVSLKSQASLEVEVLDTPSGVRTFSGRYNGVRSSQFPLVTSQDVQDSLALAMGQAVEQALADPKFQAALR